MDFPVEMLKNINFVFGKPYKSDMTDADLIGHRDAHWEYRGRLYVPALNVGSPLFISFLLDFFLFCFLTILLPGSASAATPLTNAFEFPEGEFMVYSIAVWPERSATPTPPDRGIIFEEIVKKIFLLFNTDVLLPACSLM